MPFAVIPLIHFTNDKQRMGALANRAVGSRAGLAYRGTDRGAECLAGDALGSRLGRRRGRLARMRLELGLVPILTGLAAVAILGDLSSDPAALDSGNLARAIQFELPEAVAENLPSPTYSKILVPLDHTSRDRDAIAHAAAMAKQQDAKLYLLHVEEGVTSQLYGPLASTAEVEAGGEYLQQIVRDLESQQIPVEMVVRHARTPTKEIVRYAEELKPDLVVMGAHGHKGLKDIVFGTTINAVRHKLKMPLLIVRGTK